MLQHERREYVTVKFEYVGWTDFVRNLSILFLSNGLSQVMGGHRLERTRGCRDNAISCTVRRPITSVLRDVGRL
jgi:hypothetical protein